MAMIERTEVERVRTARAQWISKSSAAERVGVADSVLENLVRAGLLETDSHWRSTILKSGPVSTVALERLVPQLEGSLTPDQTVTDTLAFNDLTARRTVDREALVSLYRAIFAGKLRPIGRGERLGLGGFVFPAREVYRYLGTAALSAALTLPQLERATGWKYEVIDHWIREGLLKAESVKMHGRSVRVLLPVHCASSVVMGACFGSGCCGAKQVIRNANKAGHARHSGGRTTEYADWCAQRWTCANGSTGGPD